MEQDIKNLKEEILKFLEKYPNVEDMNLYVNEIISGRKEVKIRVTIR